MNEHDSEKATKCGRDHNEHQLLLIYESNHHHDDESGAYTEGGTKIL